MIDELLLDFINSGDCYVLVGSGPSCEMGYPNWNQLAVRVYEAVKRITGRLDPDGYQKLLRQQRYPDLFDLAERDIGEASLIDEVRSSLVPKNKRGEIYGYLAKWPFAGYLTTNYDDEISAHLIKENVYCKKILNSPTDFKTINASLRDFVVKLHGEPGSEKFVLTGAEYSEMKVQSHGEYYRHKLGSIFSMFRVCMIGYGLRDPDIQLVLEKAKEYSTASNPIFILSTGFDNHEIAALFDNYNIRVIPYENVDGSHRQLRRILSTYDAHIVPRASVKISLPPQDDQENELASTLFLFTNMQLRGKTASFLADGARTAVLSALRQAPLGLRLSGGSVDQNSPILDTFLGTLDGATIANIVSELEKDNLAHTTDQITVLTDKGLEFVDAGRNQRNLLLDQFGGQVKTDFCKEFPSTTSAQADQFNEALQRSLVDAFRKRGLEIVNSIVHQEPVHMSDASDLFRAFKKNSAVLSGQDVRYFFIRYASNLLLHPSPLQKNFLWHLSQGYFAYHALRLDPKGTVLNKRLLSDNAWILDSSVILPLLAKDCLNHAYTVDLFERIKTLQVPAVTLESVLSEVEDHALWARDFVRNQGEESPGFLKVALAKGGARPNLFIDGYIQSRMSGKCVSFGQYMSDIFEDRWYSHAIIQRLGQANVRVIKLSEWPGFSSEDWTAVDSYTQQIAQLRRDAGTFRSDHQCSVEGEVFSALAGEITGKFKFIEQPDRHGGGFFVSQSGILNALRLPSGESKRFAWKPEAFYRFLLCFPAKVPSEDCLQQCMLSSLLTSGLEVIDVPKYKQFFSPLIRQARLTFGNVLEHYRTTVREKFPMSIEQAFNTSPDLEKPFFPLQMAEQAARSAAQQISQMNSELKLSEKEKKELIFLRRKYAKKASKRSRKGRKRK